MNWYKTHSFEYVSHTDSEIVIQANDNPNITCVLQISEVDFRFLQTRPAVYDGMQFLKTSQYYKLLELDLELLRKFTSSLYRKYYGKKRTVSRNILRKTNNK